MNYELIKDESLLREFVDWLPPLESHERYILALFYRGKYDSGSQLRTTIQLRQEGVKKDNIIETLRIWEIKKGFYKFRGISIEEDSLVPYITINPRCLRRACFLTIRDALTNIQFANEQSILNIAMTSLHKSKSRTVLVDFDIDDEFLHVEVLRERLVSILGEGNFSLLKTRGGVHILVDPKKVTNKVWYKEIQKSFKIDKSGNGMLAPPGVNQGGFIPYFIN